MSSIYEHMICVHCKASLSPQGNEPDSLICTGCNSVYPVINNIPVLLNESRSIFSFSDFTGKKSLYFDISESGKRVSGIGRLVPGLGLNNYSRKNFDRLQRMLEEKAGVGKARVLVVGGSIEGAGMSTILHSSSLIFTEGDVSFGPRTQVIFDGHDIPYEDGTFDAVIIQAVLAYVIDPQRCVSEIHRVLKKDGLVYAETAFMQQQHGGAFDFTRYTRSGMRRLFRHFEEISCDAGAGAGTVMAWSYQYFLFALFGRTAKLRLAIKFFARITGFWLKYFDRLMRSNKYYHESASGFYFLGRRSDSILADKDLVSGYPL